MRGTVAALERQKPHLRLRKKRARPAPCRCAAAFAERLAPGGSADGAYARSAGDHVWAQNVVATVWLVPSVDLRRFSESRAFANIPPKFWACVVRIMTKFVTTILLFPTGSAVIVGTHSISQSIAAAHLLRIILAEGGQRTTFSDFCFVNSVYSDAADDGGVGIDIAAIHRDLQDRTVYVPEDFPGMGLEMYDEGVKMRVFDPGKFVAMGVKHPARVKRIFGKAKGLANQYPDYNLPESNKRFNYRKEKKRRALVDIAARKMGTETDTETETDGEEDR